MFARLEPSERRAVFVAILLCAAVAAAISLVRTGAGAQSTKVYRIGLVSVGALDAGILGSDLAGDFSRRGYVVGSNVLFDRRAAEGKPDRLPGLIDELVAQHADVIITQGYSAAVAAKERAGTTPVVVTLSGAPVATGLATLPEFRKSPPSFRPNAWRCSKKRCKICEPWRCCGTPMISG